MTSEQSQECYEHHMLLKGKLDKIERFIFGDAEHSDKISFVSKVNLMFDELGFIKRFLVGSILSIFGACIFLGQQLHKIDSSSTQISQYIDSTHSMELQITEIKTELANLRSK